jgi:ferric-dicitrate binding protein FerR (iron transport regulator)
MSSENEHINIGHRLDEALESHMKTAKPKFARSKNQVWQELEAKMSEVSEEKETKIIQLNWLRYAVAASVVALVCSTLFARFYTVEVLTNNGQHLSQLLPDGSEVLLNAGSSLSFHPYWWSVNRELEFEGEGFFLVEEGSNFAVLSANGTTEVLGTSFNINSRLDGYEVLCVTGQVRVSNKYSKVLLKPNGLASSNADNKLDKTIINNKNDVVGWMENKFVFTATPMKLVLREVELQYDVQISLSENSLGALTYSGYFTKSVTVDSVLDIICQGMELSFVKTGGNTYLVSQAK